VTLNYTVASTIDAWVNVLINHPDAVQASGLPAAGSMFQDWVFLRPGGAYNRINGGWNDPLLAQWFAKGSVAKDPSKYWNQMVARFTTQAYFVPLSSGVNAGFFYYTTKNITGFDEGFGTGLSYVRPTG